ncbi:MAG: HD family hydrolase [Nitrososphaeria archaeon]|nr:HD family hydrolase [Nitrososphaeria archaeon]
MDIRTVTKATRILKNMPRTGWLQKEIPSYDAETVAEHTFEVALITLAFAFKLDDKVDNGKVLTMALVHDLSESVLGDTPKALTERLSEKVKHEIECETVKKITGSEEIRKIFKEYANGESLEAKIVKLADKLSTILQAKSYKSRGYKVDEIIETTKIELMETLKQLEDKNIVETVYDLIK